MAHKCKTPACPMKGNRLKICISWLPGVQHSHLILLIATSQHPCPTGGNQELAMDKFLNKKIIKKPTMQLTPCISRLIPVLFYILTYVKGTLSDFLDAKSVSNKGSCFQEVQLSWICGWEAHPCLPAAFSWHRDDTSTPVGTVLLFSHQETLAAIWIIHHFVSVRMLVTLTCQSEMNIQQEWSPLMPPRAGWVSNDPCDVISESSSCPEFAHRKELEACRRRNWHSQSICAPSSAR